MKRKIRRWGAYLLVKALILIAAAAPRRAGLALFSRVGGAAFRLYRRDRERALANIARAFPGSDPLVVSALAKGSFVAVARSAYDALRLARISKGDALDLCVVDGEGHLAAAYRGGKGVVALTGHIGCWELLAAYFAGKEYPVNVVYRELREERLEEMLVGMRRRHGIVSIPRGGSAVSAFKALRRGEILAMLIDQDIDVDGVFVPFFGIPAHTPRGAAAFALRSGAPMVPLAIHMQPDGRHRITVMPPLERPSTDLSEDEAVDELTARASAAVEKLIRMYPQQWVWFHDRWRKAPPVEAARAAAPRAGEGYGR